MTPPVTAADSIPYRSPETPPEPDGPAAASAPPPAADDFAADEDTSAITLHDLHSELVASSSETRRGTRRILDVLKNFGSVLDALSATVNDTHKSLRTLPAATARQPDGGELPREWAMTLIELADRIERVANGFSRPPAARLRWWPGARKSLAAWQDAWSMQADALGILRSHLDALFQRASLQRLDVLGKPFDPHTMTAIDSVVDPTHPDHTVLAETLAGWQQSVSGQLLRPAQVRVSRLPARR